jgi:hypothetical protein
MAHCQCGEFFASAGEEWIGEDHESADLLLNEACEGRLEVALAAGTRSIQAKGISPDIEVLQEVPEELKARSDTSGEASLRGHLKAEGDEQTGSQAYIPPDPKERPLFSGPGSPRAHIDKP